MNAYNNPDMYLTEALAQFSDWWVMRDLLIPADDRTTHIDFLIVSPNCIFVGELKTYRGIITGNGMHKYWKQLVGGTEIDYFSPVMQNVFHIRYLKDFLKDLPFKMHFHALVMMQGLDADARMQIQPPYPPDTSVVASADALRRITQLICERRQMEITPDEAKYIYDYIGTHQLRGEAARLRHAEEAAEYKLNARKALMQQLCPECLSPLTAQADPTGNYWICSRYPDCNYTHRM